MFQKLTVIRAVSQYYTLRIIRFFTIVAVILIVLLLSFDGWLAYQFSPWWLLLMVPILAILIAFLIVRAIVHYVALRVYPTRLSKQESADIKAFIDKLSSVIEVRHMHPVMISLASIKDIVLYRELRTIKTIIENSSTLSADYADLERKIR